MNIKINVENTLNNEFLVHDQTALGNYLAILFLKTDIEVKDFPMDRKTIYEMYLKYCQKWPGVHPLKSNTFSLVTNVFFITVGYFVLSVRTSSKTNIAELRYIDPNNRYTQTP
jgi:hypothetical protein